MKILACLFVLGTLPAQTLTVVREAPLDRTLANTLVVPKWDHGVLLTHETGDTGSSVYAFDRSGQLKFRTPIQPPQAVRIIVDDIAAAPDGTFAVAAGTFGPKGEMASVLAFLNTAGEVTRYVRLEPSTGVFNLCFAPDGTLWALVRVFDQSFKELAQYNMLRHFDASGRLVGSALPRSTFAANSGRFPAEAGHLFASRDRIAVFAPEMGTWTELSLSGEITGHWKLPLPFQSSVRTLNRFAGAVLTPENDIYIALQDSTVNGKSTSAMYRFDRTTATFGPRVPPPGAPYWQHLYGADEKTLVTSLQRAEGLAWVRPD